MRLNDSSMDFEEFQRRVIYRYRIDAHQVVRRIGPIATNARGFVEEWLSAPWSESKAFPAPEAASALQLIHDQSAQRAEAESKFVSSRYGPFRACDQLGTFQIQIDSTLFPASPAVTPNHCRPTIFMYARRPTDT